MNPPHTYESWLKYFAQLTNGGDTALAMQGTFDGTGYIAAQFKQKLAETATQMLNNNISAFVKNFNTLLTFNEIADLPPLFIKLRNGFKNCLFFTKLGFLDTDFKQELTQSLTAQTQIFWAETVAFLKKHSTNNPVLEDVLLLINRIKLEQPNGQF